MVATAGEITHTAGGDPDAATAKDSGLSGRVKHLQEQRDRERHLSRRTPPRRPAAGGVSACRISKPGFCEGCETRCHPACADSPDCVRGPVGVPSPNGKRREPSRFHEKETPRFTAQIRPSPQVTERVPGTLPRWGSRVRIPSSALEKPQVRTGATSDPRIENRPRAATVPQRAAHRVPRRSPCRPDPAVPHRRCRCNAAYRSLDIPSKPPRSKGGVGRM
jgi:hypothetical protein